MPNYLKNLHLVVGLGGLFVVIIVALIVIFGGEFSATKDKDGGSLSIRGGQALQEQIKGDCLPDEDNKAPLDCND